MSEFDAQTVLPWRGCDSRIVVAAFGSAAIQRRREGRPRGSSGRFSREPSHVVFPKPCRQAWIVVDQYRDAAGERWRGTRPPRERCRRVGRMATTKVILNPSNRPAVALIAQWKSDCTTSRTSSAISLIPDQ
jgi:hypothetical protein